MDNQNGCGTTEGSNEGTITLCLESRDRDIMIGCDESITLWQLGARMREFAHALGFAPSAIDELIAPEVEEWAITGYPVKDAGIGFRPVTCHASRCEAPGCLGRYETVPTGCAAADNTPDYRYNN